MVSKSLVFLFLSMTIGLLHASEDTAGVEPVETTTYEISKTIDFEEGWAFMEKGITKLKKIVEGESESQFTSEEYMFLYTTIYNMCTQKPPHDYSQQLYNKYKETLEQYVNSTVLPCLKETHDEFMLSEKVTHDEFMLHEVVKRWENHKIMVFWLSRFFHYLDRYFIPRWSLPPLNQVGVNSFRDLVYPEIKGIVKDAGEALNTIMSKKIKLKSSDGDVFVVDEAVGFQSEMIKHMIEDGFGGVDIPVLNLNSKILGMVLEYCENHVEAYKSHRDKVKRFDEEFVKVDQCTLFDLLMAANYLDIKSLLDLTSQTVGDMIKGKTPEEIRKTFNITNDFTREEDLEKVRGKDSGHLSD